MNKQDKNQFKIVRANSKDSQGAEWEKLNQLHFGKEINYKSKTFRYKVVEDGQLLGKIDGKLEGDHIFIDTLLTAEAARGRGVGAKLIERAEKFGKKYGARFMWLYTGVHWPANKFYQKLGFKKGPVLEDFLFNIDVVIYRREIA